MVLYVGRPPWLANPALTFSVTFDLRVKFEAKGHREGEGWVS